jgi:hypothetical protein
MNPTLDQLMASSRADEIRWLERTAGDRSCFRRLRRLVPSAVRPAARQR